MNNSLIQLIEEANKILNYSSKDFINSDIFNKLKMYKDELFIECDEYLFDDDPLLTADERKKQPGLGGSGIVRLQMKDGVLYGERNIYLGRNVPNYPGRKS